ncbi:MAG: IS21 family transposase, partial [Clostridiaceae bacterium]|nr:IS21 family transposase [Clostridiaceae bacterium]
MKCAKRLLKKLEELNDRKFKQLAGTRRSAYLEEEKSFMLPLPASEFEPAVWSVVKVPNDYLITDGRNKYSVPYNLIGEKVDIRVTRNIVEVFYHGNRVASHRRLNTMQHDPMVKLEHMSQEYQKYLAYNADDFKRWAMSVGSMTEKVVQSFLESGKAVEQGYKACAGLKRLGDRYDSKRGMGSTHRKRML